MAVTFETAAELVERLGNVPLARICFEPLPGTGYRAMTYLPPCAASDRLYELVDGTLVEKN